MLELSQINIIFAIIILIISAVIHEISHGYVAYLLGDPTAKLAGRLTLNPLKHIDPIGSIVVPAVLYLLNAGVILGWAKPVPYNPYNLRAGKWGPAYVAAAGPLSNLFLALVFGLIVRFSPLLGLTDMIVISVLSMIVAINVMLALFNLIPLPPLDGATILMAFLPYRFRRWENLFNRYQIIFLLVVVLVAGFLIDKFLAVIFYFLTGL